MNRAQGVDPNKIKEAIEGFQSADEVPGWFLSDQIGYSADTHFPQYDTSNYVTVEAGPRVNGLLVPGG